MAVFRDIFGVVNYLRDKPVTLVFRLPHRLDPFLDDAMCVPIYFNRLRGVLHCFLHTCFPDDDASGEDDMSRHAVKPLAILGAYRATAVAVECFLKPKRSRSDGAERQV